MVVLTDCAVVALPSRATLTFSIFALAMLSTMRMTGAFFTCWSYPTFFALANSPWADSMATTLHGTELCGEFKEDVFTYFITTRAYSFKNTLELSKSQSIPVFKIYNQNGTKPSSIWVNVQGTLLKKGSYISMYKINSKSYCFWAVHKMITALKA